MVRMKNERIAKRAETKNKTIAVASLSCVLVK